MKVGYTATEAYNMFRSLRREVFNYFSYDQPLSFGVRPRSSGLFNAGAIAHCNFSDNPDRPWQPGDVITDVASGIRMDATYLPYVYEDELMNIFLHELCHAVAGFSAGHGRDWEDTVVQVGAIPHSQFLMRNWQAHTIGINNTLHAQLTEIEYNRTGGTMEQWKNRSLW